MGNSATKSLPYTIGDKVAGVEHSPIFDVRKGKDNETKQDVLIFRHERKIIPNSNNNVNANANKSPEAILAANGMKRLRAMRHPYILKYLVSILIFFFFLELHEDIVCYCVGTGALQEDKSVC